MPRKIDPEEVRVLLREGKEIHLIDVREPDEFSGGHIPGAVNLPLNEVPTRLDELSRDQEYIIVCHSGIRSAKAATCLDEQGFQTRNMSGGMKHWNGEIND